MLAGYFLGLLLVPMLDAPGVMDCANVLKAAAAFLAAVLPGRLPIMAKFSGPDQLIN